MDMKLSIYGRSKDIEEGEYVNDMVILQMTR